MKHIIRDSDGSPNYSEINFGSNTSDYALITYGGYNGNQQTKTSPSSVSYGKPQGGLELVMSINKQLLCSDKQREIPWGH